MTGDVVVIAAGLVGLVVLSGLVGWKLGVRAGARRERRRAGERWRARLAALARQDARAARALRRA